MGCMVYGRRGVEAEGASGELCRAAISMFTCRGSLCFGSIMATACWARVVYV